MNEKAWIESNVFVAVTGAMHNLGILQYIAIYLYYEKSVGYTDFYLSLIDYLDKKPSTVAGKIILKLRELLNEVVDGTGVCETYLEDFGNVNWPVEEWLFLQIIKDYDRFIEEINDFIIKFDVSQDIMSNLIVYQKKIIKRPFEREFSFNISYDFPQYFQEIFNGKRQELEKRNLKISVKDENYKDNYCDYARETVWYGRKGGRLMYKEEIKISYDDLQP